MYSHYMDGSFSPLAYFSSPDDSHAPQLNDSQNNTQKKSNLLGDVTGGLTKILSGISGQFSIGKLDHGDILLMLIILFLFLEGDNLELVITLGLMILLGLND